MKKNKKKPSPTILDDVVGDVKKKWDSVTKFIIESHNRIEQRKWENDGIGYRTGL